jgi:hypothetical protein
MMGGQQQAITRDPTAPRNAVYFVILATLAKPVQVATSLRPPQPAAGPGAMGPMGPMGPGMGPEFAGPSAGAGEPPPPEATAGTAAGRAEREEIPE